MVSIRAAMGDCCVLEGGDSEHTMKKKKTKRMRTTFTEEQIQILQVVNWKILRNLDEIFQANFQIDSNPDGQDLER